MSSHVAPLGVVRTPRGHPRRWWILAALSLSMLVVGLDGTVLNVALSPISDALAASTSDLQWVVNGYLLALAVLLIPAGVLGDRLGRKRTLAAGLVLFAIASAAAAWTRSPTELIAARALMGVGAAAIMPLALSIVPTVFSAEERRKAVAVVTAALGLGMPLGPLVAGWLLAHFWWGSTLLINVPIVVIALVAVLVLIPHSRVSPTRPLDGAGVALSALGFTALVYGVVSAPTDGWGSPVVVGSLAAAVALLGSLVLVERRAVAPIASRAVVANATFVWSTVAIALASFVLLGLIFLVPQYLQAVRGIDALGTGLRLMPAMVALVVGSAAASRAQRWFGVRALICLGLMVTAVGFALLLAVTTTSEYRTLFWGLATVGCGFGVSMPPAMDAMLGALPGDQESTGVALNNAVKQLAGALGVALLGSLVSSAYLAGVLGATASLPAPGGDIARGSVQGAVAVARRLGGSGEPLRIAAQSAFVNGMHHASLACVIVSLASAVLVAVAMPRSEAESDRNSTPQPAGHARV